MSALTDRINFLARKEKTVGLTDEEKKEQAKLRDEFRAIFRKTLEIQLQNPEFTEENGNKITPPKRGE